MYALARKCQKLLNLLSSRALLYRMLSRWKANIGTRFFNKTYLYQKHETEMRKKIKKPLRNIGGLSLKQ